MATQAEVEKLQETGSRPAKPWSARSQTAADFTTGKRKILREKKPFSISAVKPKEGNDAGFIAGLFDEWDVVPPRTLTVRGDAKTGQLGSSYSTEFIDVAVNNGLQNRVVMETNYIPLLYAIFSTALLIPNVFVTGQPWWTLPAIIVHLLSLVIAIVVDYTDEALYAGEPFCWTRALVRGDVHRSSYTHLNVKDKVMYNTIIDWWMGVENDIGLVADHHGRYLATGNLFLALVTFVITLTVDGNTPIWNLCPDQKCDDGKCHGDCGLQTIYLLALYSWMAFLYLSAVFLYSEIGRFYFDEQVEAVEYAKIINKYDGIGLLFRFNDLPLWNLARKEMESKVSALSNPFHKASSPMFESQLSTEISQNLTMLEDIQSDASLEVEMEMEPSMLPSSDSTHRKKTLDKKTAELALQLGVEVETGVEDIATQAHMELMAASHTEVNLHAKDKMSDMKEETSDEELFNKQMEEIAERKAKSLVKRLVRQNQDYEEIMEQLQDFKQGFQEEMNEFAIWYDRVGGVKQLLRALQRKRRAMLKQGMGSRRFAFFALLCGATASLSVLLVEPRLLLQSKRPLLVNVVYLMCIPVIAYAVILVMRALHRARLLYQVCTQLMRELDTPIDLTMDSMGAVSSRHAIAKLACWWEVRLCFKNYRVYTTYNALNNAFASTLLVFFSVSVYLLVTVFLFSGGKFYKLSATSLLMAVYFVNNGYSLYSFLAVAADMWRAQRDHVEMLQNERLALMYQSGTLDLVADRLKQMHAKGPQDRDRDGVISKAEERQWKQEADASGEVAGELAAKEIEEVMQSISSVAEFLENYDAPPRILGIDVTDNALLAFQTYAITSVATVFLYFMFGDSLN